MGIPTFDFNFASGTNITYRFEVYDASDSLVTGLLYDDYATGVTNWDTDSNGGLETTYDLKVYATIDTIIGGDMFLETLSTDIAFKDSAENSLFDLSSASVSFGTESKFNYAKASNIDTTTDTIEFTGAIGDKIANSDAVDDGDEILLFEVSGAELYNYDNYFDTYGSFYDGFKVDDGTQIVSKTNTHETIFSFRSGDNASIKSISEAVSDAAGTIADEVTVSESSGPSLVEAKSNLIDYGTTIYTERKIGSSDVTSLIRSGDTVKARAFWANSGNFEEAIGDITIADGTDTSIALVSSEKTLLDYTSDLEGIDFSTLDSPDYSGQNGLQLDMTFKVSSAAGTKLSGENFYTVKGVNEDSSVANASLITENVVTFQGDLNYDGRVSLTDLAFLNAGKIAEQATGSTSDDYSDVDADFDGVIDTADLSILSRDWNKSLHTSSSGSTVYESEDVLSSTTWANTFLSQDPFDGLDINSGTALGFAYSNSAFNYQDGVESDFLTAQASMYDSISL